MNLIEQQRRLSEQLAAMPCPVGLLDHCWHGAAQAVGDHPALYAQVCCHCGAARRGRWERPEDGEHGPFYRREEG